MSFVIKNNHSCEINHFLQGRCADMEATVTVAGTSHRVNGIAVQPKVFGPHPPSQALPAIAKRKKRTIPVETQNSLCMSQEKRKDHNLSRHPLTTCLSMK